jgi:poly-gamma-glutamate synthesis protein (capsule biosynthesis protein)
MTARLLIVGDVCPINANEAPFAGGAIGSLAGGLTELVGRADLAVANLECPLVARPTPIAKSGAAIGAPVATAVGLKALGFHAYSLANNHIMDHGAEGLASTRAALDGAGIPWFGIGATREEAARPLETTVRGIDVSIFTAAESEFSIVGANRPGANPIDPARLALAVSDHARRGRFVVVLLHAGKEYYPYPPPGLQDLAHVLLEAGARCIVCQHSHCMGAIERHAAGVAFYGQGNMLFDWATPRPASWYEGFALDLQVAADRSFEFALHPVKQVRGTPGVTVEGPDAGKALKVRLESMGAQCATHGFVDDEWRAFCRAKRDLYFSILKGHGRVARALNRRTGLATGFYSEEALSTLLNVVRCESHREVLLTVLDDTLATRTNR